jgi:hypothetical protein
VWNDARNEADVQRFFSCQLLSKNQHFICLKHLVYEHLEKYQIMN